MARYLNRYTKEWYGPPVDTGDCGPDYIRNPDLSAVEGIPQQRWIVEGDAVRAPTTEEAAAFDAADLEAAKQSRLAEIDNRTSEIIQSGAVIVNGEEVSTSLAAQVSLNGMESLYRLGVLTFPQQWSATNGMSYTINSYPDFVRVAGIVGTFVHVTKAAGRALRAQVLACTTVAQVQAVEDSR